MLALVFGGLAGCGETCAKKPEERRFSTPKSEPVEKVTMGGGPVPDPIGVSSLVTVLPELTALSPLAQATVEGVLNTLPAPCLPCEVDESSIAACLLRAPAGCENLPVLGKRAVRLAQAGASPGAVRATVTYAEPWTSPAMRGASAADGRAATAVELWIDPGFGPWVEAVARAEQLLSLGETDVDVGPVVVSVRVLPSGRGAEDPAREAARQAVVAADGLGLGLPYASCLSRTEGTLDETSLTAAASCAGLPMESWNQARSEAAKARLKTDLADAQVIGLRAAPSWRIDGYRLRGHRELASLRDLVENQHIDRRTELPAALLQAWDPGIPTPPDPAGTPTP